MTVTLFVGESRRATVSSPVSIQVSPPPQWLVGELDDNFRIDVTPDGDGFGATITGLGAGHGVLTFTGHIPDGQGGTVAVSAGASVTVRPASEVEVSLQVSGAV